VRLIIEILFFIGLLYLPFVVLHGLVSRFRPSSVQAVEAAAASFTRLAIILGIFGLIACGGYEIVTWAYSSSESHLGSFLGFVVAAVAVGIYALMFTPVILVMLESAVTAESVSNEVGSKSDSSESETGVDETPSVHRVMACARDCEVYYDDRRRCRHCGNLLVAVFPEPSAEMSTELLCLQANIDCRSGDEGCRKCRSSVASIAALVFLCSTTSAAPAYASDSWLCNAEASQKVNHQSQERIDYE
jgi:hypothetical protein